MVQETRHVHCESHEYNGVWTIRVQSPVMQFFGLTDRVFKSDIRVRSTVGGTSVTVRELPSCTSGVQV
jgi:hypothetical protein